MRSKFDEQLTLLHKDLIMLGALCEEAISDSAKALLNERQQRAALIEQIKDLGGQIEQKEREVENRCLKLLLQQQPVASDLRTISAALKMVTDMERIGHQSADIAEIISLANISPANIPTQQELFAGMAAAVIKMVTESIDAFVKQDVAMAQAVIAYDDVVDDYFNQIRQLLIALFGRPETDGEQTIDLLMIAKYFERIGDHAVNIASWVLFAITGRREG